MTSFLSPPADRRRATIPAVKEGNLCITSSRVATALTPIAFFETVMVKSYETLADSGTRVDVHTGIVAASRLPGRDRVQGLRHREMRVQLGKISEAVRSVVPESMWGRSSRSWRS
jgi:hypothetical protein